MDKYTHCRGAQSSAKLGKIPRRKGSWGRGLADLKGPKDGMSNELIPLLGLALIDIYLLRGFFFPSRNTHPQIKVSADLCSTDYRYETQESRSHTQKLVDGSLGCSWSVATDFILLAPFCHCQTTQWSKLLPDKKPL